MKLNFLLHRVGPLWYNGAIEEMARSRIGQRGADHVGEIYPKSSCTLDAWVEHIVHIDGVTGSSPVQTTKSPWKSGISEGFPFTSSYMGFQFEHFSMDDRGNNCLEG